MAAILPHLLILLVFLMFAIIFSLGKGASLIAGYNTKSDTEKAQYNEKALCKFMGKVMYGLSASVLLWMLSDLFDQPSLVVVGIVAFFAVSIFAIVYMNTGNRFKRDNKRITE